MTDQGVFAKYDKKVYKHRFRGLALVHDIHGGTPSDPKKAEGWIRSKLAPTDAILQQMVAETMAERGIEADAAISETATLKGLNGFKRDTHGLYIEGRQLKACIKEAANIHWPKESWGPSRKGTRNFWPEHVFVDEDRLHLGVQEPTALDQRFVHTWRGSGIQYEEAVEEAKITFHVKTDYAFTHDQWGELWAVAQNQGLGASRSLGHGTFTMLEWEQLS